MSVKEAFNALADKNSEKRWLITEADREGNLSLVKEGSTDLEDLFENLAADKIYFCVFKVYGLDEREACVSKRDKLVEITWIGPSVSPMRRNAPLQTKSARAELFNGVVFEMSASTIKELSKENIAKKLVGVGGAHKPTRYDFGGELSVPADFYEHGSV
jgi:hypothetical protein